MAIVAGLSEAGAGLLLALGLLTPLAAVVMTGTLVVAASVHWAAGLWGQNGGFELPLVYAVVAATLAFTGPGTYSLDNALGLGELSGVGGGLVAAVVGLLIGLAVVARARRAIDADASIDSAPTARHDTVAA